ncbi:MAG TPA: 4-hydroxy-3-methylbut-2-enyl diphosphate reductase [bacterium]
MNDKKDFDSVLFYQKGLGLKKEVAGVLQRDYHSKIIEEMRARDFRLQIGELIVFLAKEFGFCYGVDRAVDYAYQAREKFPDRRIFLTGEIIHNPHVNQRLIQMGVQFLSGQYSNGLTLDDLRSQDVVILPAFGVSVSQFQNLKKRDCILVDTTCGSVLNVWKRVEFYAQHGYTAVIHGKYFHEETIATSSQALKYPDGKYLIVRTMDEAKIVGDYILNGRDKASLQSRFDKASSPDFDPDRDLEKIGVANQTTMLSSESLAIAEEFKKVMIRKFGPENLDAHFQNFDTICSATQERQDAVLDLVRKHGLDIMLVIGGYNSSNTNHLAVMAAQYCPTFHIDDPMAMVSKNEIRHKRIGGSEMVTNSDWLPEGPLKIGITAGASTPNNKIGEAIEKLLSLRGIALETMFSC